jgi:Delta7-sterol 5-desaturase
MLYAELSPLIALVSAALITSVIVALRYFASSGLFAWLTGIVRPGLYAGRRRQIMREMRYSRSTACLQAQCCGHGTPAGPP